MISLLVVASLLTQCTKDPESVTNPGTFSSADYPATIEQLYNVLIPAYAALRDGGLYGVNYTTKVTTCLDHTVDKAFLGQPEWSEMAQDNLSVNNIISNSTWVSCYKGIKGANVFLDRLEFYKKNSTRTDQTQLLDNMKGEALFLRALYYYYLETLFGEAYIHNGTGGDKMGVPLVKLTGSLEETQVPRNTVREVWDYIINDLKQSEALLKGKVWPAIDKGRVNEWAAKALLGKAYLFTEDWANAKSKLKEVIDNSGKTLMPFAKYRNAFNGDAANEFNEESLFELNIDRDVAVKVTDVTNLSTTYSRIIAPSYLGNDGTETNALATGFGNEFVHDKNLLRYGFNLPRWTLVNNPNFNAAAAPSRANPKQIIDPAYKKTSLDLRTNKTVDPRLYVNALQPWVDSISSDGNKTFLTVAIYKEIPLDQRAQHYGWSLRKYASIDYNPNAFQGEDNANIYILRLADVYLMYAEASMQTGDNTTALEYINKVKRRAYSLPINTPSAIDYTSLISSTMASDDVLKNSPLRYERWAELFGEMHWWMDVCRWRIGKQEADYYLVTVGGGNINWSDNKSYALPIPLNELTTNAQIKQNPGY